MKYFAYLKKIIQKRMKYLNKKRILSFLAFFVTIGVVITSVIFLSMDKEKNRIQFSPPVDLNLSQFSDKNINNNSNSGNISVSTNSKNPKSSVCSLGFSLFPLQRTIIPNDYIDYTLTIQNTGGLNCENTSVSIYYADNETFVSSDPKATSSNYYWNIGNLAPSEQKNILIKTIGTDSGGSNYKVKTEACATANNTKDVCSDSSVTIGNSTILNNNIIPSSIKTTENPTVSILNTTPNNPIKNISDKEYGTWVWVSPTHITKTYANTILEAASANKINVLYVTFDDYLEINALPDGLEKENKIKEYSDAVFNLVKIAKEKGISIDAEAGARDWGEKGNHSISFPIIDYILNYNSEHPSYKIRGFQYDVESYLLPTYEDNKVDKLTNFISFIDDTVSYLNGKNMRFSVVLPHFYDGVLGWTPEITYKSKTNYTFNLVLQILDTRPDSSVIIMAYRNFAENNNGSINLSQTEVEEASNQTHPTKIIVAQETGNVQPDYVTFYGMSKNDYLKQINLITDAFKNYSAFGGIAVHYIDTFLKLK